MIKLTKAESTRGGSLGRCNFITSMLCKWQVAFKKKLTNFTKLDHILWNCEKSSLLYFLLSQEKNFPKLFSLDLVGYSHFIKIFFDSIKGLLFQQSMCQGRQRSRPGRVSSVWNYSPWWQVPKTASICGWKVQFHFTIQTIFLLIPQTQRFWVD